MRENRILAIALDVKQHAQGVPTILVSKDLNLRIKADALGLDIEDYESDKVDIEELYSGYPDMTVNRAIIPAFRKREVAMDTALLPHQYVTLVASNDPAQTAYAPV